MPYDIYKRKGKWVVVNDETGKVKGTHATRKEALAHMRALYANVPEAREKAAKRERARRKK